MKARVVFVLAARLSVTANAHLPLPAQGVGESTSVRTVRYVATTNAPAQWKLDAKPVLELGGATGSGPTEFSNIAGVVRLSDGRIAVANGATTEIRIFSPRGDFQRAVGRRGQGPGEFSYLWSLQAAADTTFATDNSGRAQLFAPDGAVLRSLARPVPATGTRPERVGLLANGDAVVSTLRYPADTTGDEFTVLRVVLRESPTGPSYRQLFQFPAERRRRGADGRIAVLHYAPSGTAVARGGRICAGYRDQYRITCYDSDGRALFRIDRAMTPRAIAEPDRQLARDGYVAGNLRPGSQPELKSRLEEESRRFQFAVHAPAFGRLLLADSGELWVSEFDPTDDIVGTPSFRTTRTPLRWSIFGPTGAWLADVVLPARFTPYDAGRDVVAGVTIDADDLERVTIWRVQR